MPPAKKSAPASETFAYRTFHNRFEVFLTVPDTLAEDLPYFLPKFASEMVKGGLKPREDDDWEWRSYSRKTAEKHAGVKLVGSKAVIFLWGYNFNSKVKIEKLAKLLPYPVNVVTISEDEEFDARRIRSVK